MLERQADYIFGGLFVEPARGFARGHAGLDAGVVTKGWPTKPQTGGSQKHAKATKRCLLRPLTKGSGVCPNSKHALPEPLQTLRNLTRRPNIFLG